MSSKLSSLQLLAHNSSNVDIGPRPARLSMGLEEISRLTKERFAGSVVRVVRALWDMYRSVSL